MKQDAEARIAHLESELLRWQSDYAALAESEKHLQTERDRYMDQAASLRTDLGSCENEREKFRAETNDLKRLLDKERRHRMDRQRPPLGPQTTSSSKLLSAIPHAPEIITVESDPEIDVKDNVTRDESKVNERTSAPSSAIGSIRRSVFARVELKATSLHKRQTLNDKPEIVLSKRAFAKSNADHPPIERPSKKPKIHENQKPVSASTQKGLLSLDGTMRMSSPEIEADASVQPEPVSQISSAALNSHPTPPSLVENDNQTRPRLSRSRSSSLSDLTPASSVVTSDEENIEHALNPVLSRIPGSFRIRELDLPPAAVYQPVSDVHSKYLQGIPTLGIDPPPSNTSVSRAFLNHKFGGGEMQFTAVMDKIGSRRHQAMFPKKQYNPLMASTPGAPGLIYTGRNDLTNDPMWRLFSFIQGSSKPAVWRYLGTYALSRVGNLTAAEFRSQPRRVQNSLVKAIFTRNWDGYPAMRARIFLRKKSRAVNNATVQAELNKFKTKSKCHYAELTKVDVMDALVRGDETITVLLMTCVGYDYDFAADFSSFKDYQHRPLPVRGSNTTKAKETGGRSSSVESDS